ncbi:MAG TPA: hypothetical protein VLD39_08165 [Gammaproteobacteria bacterium]|nr:hypothetical protein [Gammaproteobacteria bacterium]
MSTSRPIAAYAVPVALVALGTLDLAVALLPQPADETIAGMLARWSLMLIALAGALQLTCAALILMRRRLGRSLYLYGLPVTLVLGGALSYLQVAARAADDARTDLLASSLGWLLSAAIYAAVAYALTRPALEAWLSPAVFDPGAGSEPATHTPALLAGLALRIAAFVALLAFMVLVLDAPVGVLYIGAAAVAAMVALRYLLVQRLRKTAQNHDDEP